MSANEASAKWINLLTCPITDFMTISSIPTGTDKSNYIVIDRMFTSKGINCIHKYNTNTNKWNKMPGLDNIQNISLFSATLDVNKQILYLIHRHSVSEIQLNNSNIHNYTHNTTIKR
eukprot:96121_1